MPVMRHVPTTPAPGYVPDDDPAMDQCGLCGSWYRLTPQRVPGACWLHDGQGSSGGDPNAPLADEAGSDVAGYL